MGVRSGARIICYCDSQRVHAIDIYSKGDREDIPSTEILDALRDTGLMPEPDDADTE